MSVLLLATFDTKEVEASYLIGRLAEGGVPVERCDLSLRAECRSAADKLAAMEGAAARALDEIARAPGEGRRLVCAIGGGTGGQIAVDVMRALPIEMPKVMVSTMPFDPRYAMADNAIVLVPTIADLVGLNATVRQALDRAAAIVAGLYGAALREGPIDATPSVGVTALGVTAPGIAALVPMIAARGSEATVFHASGFGGAAFVRWCDAGAFLGVIDFTPHELTRIHVAGVHVDMPRRFTAAGGLPRVTVLGGVNFVGLGERHLMPDAFRARPSYVHSPLFTHVKCTAEEGRRCARLLGGQLAQGDGPSAVIAPMGGFSSEDRAGGAIEDPGFRALFADALEAALDPRVTLRRVPWHINTPETARAAVDTLFEMMEMPA